MGNWSPRVFTWGGEDLRSCKSMTDTLAPVERTNWALSAWNSTLDRNDVPSAWLYGQDHQWATGHLVSSPGEGRIWDLVKHDRHIGTCGAHQLGVIGLEFYP